ncbi:MAG TPA: DUF4167 domain-containing protein [Microvirga sp.]|nr:DUF4167 domain-containing protein [Microvirga sp.]
MRGRNRNNTSSKGPNPLTKSYESNGPDVKIRGTAQHIAEKYSQLARDSQASGDPVAAENYFQHAEHYFRIIAAAQEQLREQYGYQQRFDDEGDDEGFAGGERSGFGNGEDSDPAAQPQPYEMRAEGERPSRFDRNERQDRGDRPDRADRPERGDRPERADRPERNDRPERGDRQDRGDRRERFQRDRAPRQEFQRDDQPFDRNEGDRPARFDRGDRPERNDRPERVERPDRPERVERSERNGRGPFRRERRPEEADAPDAGGLPAFLTNPVRVPAPVAEENRVVAPIVQEANDEADARPRRRRRTRREMIEDAGGDIAGFTPDVETPAAE